MPVMKHAHETWSAVKCLCRRACELLSAVDCRLRKLGTPVFRRYTPVSWGAWMRESAADAGDDRRVWVMKHFSGGVLLQYDSWDDWTADRVASVHELARPFFGTGHVVYRAAVYYHHAGTDQVVRSDHCTITRRH